MNYTDLIIIYLAGGSPFGVYYFFNSNGNKKLVWLKSVLIIFVWIPYAFQLLYSNVTSKLNNSKLSDISNQQNTLRNNLAKLQRGFEDYLPTNKAEMSLFELREIIERYSELTTIQSELNGKPANHEKEIFRINGNNEIEISAICLNRRNHKRLLSHQTQAKSDFLKSLRILFNSTKDVKKLGEHSIEFVKLLNEDEALISVFELYKEFSQTLQESNVSNSEKDLWTTQEPKQSNTKQISIRLQT